MENRDINELVQEIVKENKIINKDDTKNDFRLKIFFFIVITFMFFGIVWSIRCGWCMLIEEGKQHNQLVKDGWEYMFIENKNHRSNSIIKTEAIVRQLLDSKYGITNYYFYTTNINVGGETYSDHLFWYKAIPKNK